MKICANFGHLERVHSHQIDDRSGIGLTLVIVPFFFFLLSSEFFIDSGGSLSPQCLRINFSNDDGPQADTDPPSNVQSLSVADSHNARSNQEQCNKQPSHVFRRVFGVVDILQDDPQ